ncbi:MAG: hypothetical protein ACT4NV_10450 [Rhodoferax sp.]
MPHTDDLFADFGPEFAPVPDRLQVVAGKVVATTNKPNALQKRFNTLMETIDATQASVQQLRHALDTHGSRHRHALHDLDLQRCAVCTQMVVLLDERIQAPAKPKGLTANQKQQATRIVLGLCDMLGDSADPTVRAIAQRYDTEDDDAGDESEAVKSLLESYLGPDFAQGRNFDSPEEVLAAAMEHARQEQQAAHDKREARKEQRRAKKGPSARETAQAQKQLDAQSALRTVYRQLASALHPDRESDPALRAQKTALMSEVNAAYERQDLSSLLRIQLQSEMVDASKAAALSDAKLKAMCDLLTEQIKALEADQWQLRGQMEVELGFPHYVKYSEATLLGLLEDERQDQEDEIGTMRADLERVRADEKAFKAWLKQQAAAHKASLREEEMDPFSEMLAEMVRFR